jgi:hypothetical protein
VRSCLTTGPFAEKSLLLPPHGDDRECHENSQGDFGEAMRRHNPRRFRTRSCLCRPGADAPCTGVPRGGYSTLKTSTIIANGSSSSIRCHPGLDQRTNGVIPARTPQRAPGSRCQRGLVLIRRGGPRSKALVRRFAPLAPKQNAVVLCTPLKAYKKKCHLL